jgi:hypothetical protein
VAEARFSALLEVEDTVERGLNPSAERPWAAIFCRFHLSHLNCLIAGLLPQEISE